MNEVEHLKGRDLAPNLLHLKLILVGKIKSIPVLESVFSCNKDIKRITTLK